MAIQTVIALILTVLASVSLVAVIILLGWFLIWKAFLSKFRLVRELLGQEHEPVEQQTAENNQVQRQPYAKVKKARKD